MGSSRRRHREIAGCVPLSADRARCLLITSRHYPNHLVFPKGGVKKGETEREAAGRETWEECGAVGTVGKEITCVSGANDGHTLECVYSACGFVDIKDAHYDDDTDDGEEETGHDDGDKAAEKQKQKWFEMIVERVYDEFPEMGQRMRRWYFVREARRLSNLRPITRRLLEAVCTDDGKGE